MECQLRDGCGGWVGGIRDTYLVRCCTNTVTVFVWADDESVSGIFTGDTCSDHTYAVSRTTAATVVYGRVTG